MTQRSILAGTNPTVIIKAGVDVTVKGVDGEMVTAESTNKWGLKVEKHSEAEFARARAVVGEVVLFDLRLKKPNFGEKNAPEDVIEVQVGGSGEVQVPFGSNIKVYAGKDIDVQGVRGRVDAFAGFRLSLQDVTSLGNASAGWSMNLDCQRLLDEKAEFKAGGDIRLHVHDLDSAFIRVRDLGGFWEARIGGGLKSISLKCGGDVTLVTNEKVEALPPNYILGKIEKPAGA
jgi:hypothetical protein